MFSFLASLITTLIALFAPMQGPVFDIEYELSLLKWPTSAAPTVLPTYDHTTVGAASAGEVQKVDLPQIPPINYQTATAIANVAGWPAEKIQDLLIIARCEAGSGSEPASWIFYPGETGDSGRSLGWLQLNEGHFPRAASAGSVTIEESHLWWDPTVNAKVALWLYNARGQRFAGGGGWSCADIHGVYP